MSARSTPFGLFAGGVIGVVGECSRLQLRATREYRRHTRLDTDVLLAAVEQLKSDLTVRRTGRYRCNDTLYDIAGRIRYVEQVTDSTGNTEYRLTDVQPDAALDVVLAAARRETPWRTLVEALETIGASYEEAEEYLASLVQAQILQPDYGLSLTADDPDVFIASTMASSPALSEVRAAIERLNDKMRAIDKKGVGQPTSAYDALLGDINLITCGAAPRNPFRVDLHKTAEAISLSEQVIAEVLRGATLLHSVQTARSARSLDRFVMAFQERYGEAEVALLEALDPDFGIGRSFESQEVSRFSEAENRVTNRHIHLLRLLEDAWRTSAREIVLTPEDLQRLVEPSPTRLPDTTCVWFSVEAPGAAALDRGQFRIVMNGIGGSTGVNLLTRFAHGDPDLRSWILQHLRLEETYDPDATYAEVLHLPTGKVGNIVSRPRLREFELPYLNLSSEQGAQRIGLRDLFLVVVNGKLELRSTVDRRKIVPRLTTAHAAHHPSSLPVYRFLAELQTYGRQPGSAWSWGDLSAAGFLPRVRVGRIVLARARWRVGADETKPLITGTLASRLLATRNLRKSRDLPRWVTLGEADEKLLLDFEDELSVDALNGAIHVRQDVVFEELLPEPGDTPLCGPEGQFASEFLLPIECNPEARSPRGVDSRVAYDQSQRVASGIPEEARTSVPNPRTRLCVPGGEWLYAKLYTSTRYADEVLRLVIPTIEKLRAEGLVTQEFFIRYADPDEHLRIRLRTHGGVNASLVFSRLSTAVEPWIRTGLVNKFQVDTYAPEVERYGGYEAIELAHTIFCADSRAVSRLISRIEPSHIDENRGVLALVGTDHLLSDFDLSYRERLELLSTLEVHRLERASNVSARRMQFGANYRARKRRIITALDHESDWDVTRKSVDALFERRSAEIRPAALELRRLASLGRLVRPLESICASLIHMGVNRLGSGRVPDDETEVYDHLTRYYRYRIGTAPQV